MQGKGWGFEVAEKQNQATVSAQIKNQGILS